MSFFFVVNPVAGGGKAVRFWQAFSIILQRLGVEFEHAFTEYPGHATELARKAVADGYAACIGVGGDGTLHELVPALIGTDTALGCIPAGTGNDFARGIGLPRSPELLASLVTTAPKRLIDVPRVNDQLYLNVAGAGFDAIVADTVNRQFQAISGGALPYLLSTLKTLITYRNTSLTIRFDDGPTEEYRVLLVAAGNLKYYGGGMKICPTAAPDDGYLDFCIAGDLTKAEALCTIPKVFKGTHLTHPKCTYLRAKQAFIDGPPLPIQADGQIVGALPAAFSLEPAALWALIPAQHPIRHSGESQG